MSRLLPLVPFASLIAVNIQASTLAAPQAGDFDTWWAFPTRDFEGRNSYPYDLEVADLNGDGAVDVAVANWWATSNVSVLIGRGDGRFGEPSHFEQAEPSRGIVVGDFDGDGDVDIVATDSGQNWDGATVSLHRNRGDATFEASVAFPTAVGPAGLTCADFDGDGHLDLAVVGTSFAGASTLSILIGDGTGGFAAPVVHVSGSHSYRPEAADLDGDGWIDVVVARGNNRVSVFRNGPTGLGPAQDVAVGPGGFGISLFPTVELEDFDRDGDVDIIYSSTGTFVAGTSQADGSLRLLRNDGSGNFGAHSDIPVAPYIGGAVETAVGDLDGDGNLDVVTVHGDNGSWTRLLGDGTGSFDAGPERAGGRAPVAIELADVDGDDLPDALVLSRDSLGLFVHRNRGGGDFGDHATRLVVSWAQELDAADVDGDGDRDVVTVSNYAFTGDVLLFKNDGSGGLSPKIPIHTGHAAQSIKLRDVTGDGHPDALWSDGGGAPPYDFWTAASDGAGGFLPAVEWPVGTCAAGDVEAFDMDGDGDLDVALTEFGSCGGSGGFNYVYISENLGGGVFAPATLQPAWMSPTVVAGDFNHDGALDMCVAGAAGPELHLGNGDRTFQTGTVVPVPGGAWPLAVGDLDRDGRLDLVSATNGDPDGTVLSVHVGRGDGTFEAPARYPGTITPQVGNARYLMVEDVDGDGDLDVMAVNGPNGDVSLWRNRGDGELAPHVRIGAGLTMTDAAFGDFDGDGRGDLMAARQIPPAQLDAELALVRGLPLATTPSRYCTGKLNSLGHRASTTWTGTPSGFAQDFRVGVRWAIPGSFALAFVSATGPASTPLWNGTLCVGGALMRMPVVALDGEGAGSYEIDVPVGLVGATNWFQFMYRDAAQPDGTGIAMSNGLQVLFTH